MNSTYECLTCKLCAQLLTRYEALKRAAATIQSRPGACAAEVSEVIAQVGESRRAYAQHWETHRKAHVSSSNITGQICCAAV